MSNTRAYFGDGVYAEFTGFDIVLTANGIGAEATDRIHLQPQMIEALKAWRESDYRDHASGQTFAEAQRPQTAYDPDGPEGEALRERFLTQGMEP